jgi:sugar phosphate isomerase/epimerase
MKGRLSSITSILPRWFRALSLASVGPLVGVSCAEYAQSRAVPMSHPLSLHQLVACDVTPSGLVEIAAALGCRHVCLFTQQAEGGLNFPVVAEQDIPALRRQMDAHGITAWGLASFALTPGLDVETYRGAIERGALLGARRANVRVVDPDEARATDHFAAFASLCTEHGIVAGIEFTGFANADALPQALRIVRAAVCGGIAVDALHMVRTGTTIADLEWEDPDLISYVQLCDGPLAGTAAGYAREGAFDRLCPGDGEFPLRALIGLLHQDFPLSLEVPSERWRAAGVPPLERASRVVASTRRLLDSISHARLA